MHLNCCASYAVCYTAIISRPSMRFLAYDSPCNTCACEITVGTRTVREVSPPGVAQCVSVGYGHIAPRTDLGRLATMIYAIFGVPLTVFTVANLGTIMATAFRVIYKFVCCGPCCLCCRSRTHRDSSRITSKISQQSVDDEKNARTRDDGQHPRRERSSGSQERRQRIGSVKQLEPGEELKRSQKKKQVDCVVTLTADDVGWQRGRFETWRLQLTSVFTDQSSIDKVDFDDLFDEFNIHKSEKTNLLLTTAATTTS